MGKGDEKICRIGLIKGQRIENRRGTKGKRERNKV